MAQWKYDEIRWKFIEKWADSMAADTAVLGLWAPLVQA
jgi:hypothetical protein